VLLHECLNLGRKQAGAYFILLAFIGFSLDMGSPVSAISPISVALFPRQTVLSDTPSSLAISFCSVFAFRRIFIWYLGA
jgi:hypothetical protein